MFDITFVNRFVDPDLGFAIFFKGNGLQNKRVDFKIERLGTHWILFRASFMIFQCSIIGCYPSTFSEKNAFLGEPIFFSCIFLQNVVLKHK